MTTLTMTARDGGFLLSEATGNRSRSVVTVTLPSGGLTTGTVLGQITSSSKYVRHAAGASDGSEDEAGILLLTDTATGDKELTIITRDAEVDGSKLTYEDGADAAQILVTNAALEALGIIVR